MRNDLWGKVLSTLEKRINRPSFNTWLRPTTCLSVDRKQVCIGVPNEVFVYWLGEHYVQLMTDILTELLGFQPDISFVVETAADNAGEHPAPAEQIGRAHAAPIAKKEPKPAGREQAHQRAALAADAAPEPPSRAVRQTRSAAAPAMAASAVSVAPNAAPRHIPAEALNASYTFSAYVVGSGNRFAHAAALAVADQMAENYNPLFIYGGVGLGKTHILHAIGNHAGRIRPNARILYLSSEQFVNELVTSIREDRMTWFREKYRSIDLLLVDDIQFIARKERTQEEFFHTFNTLYQAGKQIVLTSDCPPKKIPTIAEQLRSRFEWGLIADIQPPDLETRIAILKKKADGQGLNLPDDVAMYIASNVRSNIRELEGCLSKIRAYAMLYKAPLSVALAQKALTDMFEAKIKRPVTVELVQQIVARHYQVEPAQLNSASRDRRVTLPRQIAMYLARELTNMSLPDIGRNFGGRDHTTVMHACKKVEKTQADDAQLKERLMQIRELIKA